MKKNTQNPFQKAAVQLCRREQRLPADGSWLYELKYDGYRIVAYVEGDSVRLLTRNGNNYSKKFHELISPLKALAKGGSFVLDGEVIVADSEGKSDFNALQSYHKGQKGNSLIYIVFDILALDGEDLRSKTLLERKNILSAVMKSPPKKLKISEYIDRLTKADLDSLCEQNYEGIVAKRRDSVYSGTRNGDWIKVKCPLFLRKISSPDKLMFEGITKLEVAEYYNKISGRMLPYIKNRLISLVRCPEGTGKPCFFKKHPTAESIGIKKVGDYFSITSVEGLINEVQMNTIEFHVWGSSADDIDNPDIMVFDLDPDEGMDLEKVRQGVEDLKAVLTELGLTAFLKTSGGKGYHVVVPFSGKTNWTDFKDFSRKLAELMENRWQNKYTTNVRKVSRKGKIFIDYLRNGKGATSVAPYSVRARAGARVSLPIKWEELYKVAPDGISMQEALSRLNSPDPWENFWTAKENQKLIGG